MLIKQQGVGGSSGTYVLAVCFSACSAAGAQGWCWKGPSDAAPSFGFVHMCTAVQGLPPAALIPTAMFGCAACMLCPRHCGLTQQHAFLFPWSLMSLLTRMVSLQGSLELDASCCGSACCLACMHWVVVVVWWSSFQSAADAPDMKFCCLCWQVLLGVFAVQASRACSL